NRPCKLVVGSCDNIVAIGHVQDSLDGTLLHGREIGESNYRISIEIALNHNAPLPILNPDDPDTSNIGLALGSHVAWPKFFVIFDNDPVNFYLHLDTYILYINISLRF
ncbi:hypothetical protein TorRG33x02_054180, partial [Trema orientale]